MHQLIPFVVKQFEGVFSICDQNHQGDKIVYVMQGNSEFPPLYKILELQSFIQPSIASDAEPGQSMGKTSSLASWTYLFHTNYFICKNVSLVNTLIKKVKRTFKNYLSQPFTFNKHQPKMSLQHLLHEAGKRAATVPAICDGIISYAVHCSGHRNTWLELNLNS